MSRARRARRLVEVLPDRHALVRAAAARVAALARRAIRARGCFTIALAGGATPRPLYRRLAAVPPGVIDWRCVHVFWGDERCVPPDDPRSNFRAAREALLDAVPVPPAQVHRMRGEARPARAAAAYEALLRRRFAAPGARRDAPPGAGFDLVLLGMGRDGHLASLFPGGSAVRERVRWVLPQRVPAEPPARLTLTPVILNAASQVLFLVAGGAKARRLRDVLRGPRQPEVLPAQAIAPARGTVRWMVDAAAAAGLRSRGRAGGRGRR
ncbi:MAG: 6-phosphogluconolactonase [Armatimonadota bacterium]|nr:6-phosphogluconolactonase [Armatimonadota bacterium]MDR7454416.1 6-phosphogluconolactonase [Armatimonadota bacterium]MDR7496936.1 6-phosphogluconolactonase [Armatimonadota bacterium]